MFWQASSVKYRRSMSSRDFYKIGSRTAAATRSSVSIKSPLAFALFSIPRIPTSKV